ncbi:cation/H(+) antiporter 24-like [Pistacia vera]|uniref:cation/H(+) antiporter 24-like n=1 Tax=Pistacia vera TaxID=55513 RepID=UPI001262E502|nr:cation/H(+) antiporter 24-like [Pistacia vera]
MVDVRADDLSKPFNDGVIYRFPLTCKKIHRAHTVGIFYGESPLQYSFTLIMLEVIFVVFTTWILRFLLKPLKQPRIISEIIGGVIIGPSVLGRNKNFSEKIFPEDAQYVLRNIAIMGFMYFLFLAGVRMDLTLIKRSGKREVYISLFGFIVPTMTMTIVAFLTRKWMDPDLAKTSSIIAISSAIAVTSFPVLYPVLKDLNLLCSEVGRIAMSLSVVSAVIGLNGIVAFEAVKQGEGEGLDALWFLLSLIILLTFIFTVIQRVMTWIVDRTPEGKPVNQGLVVGILLGVMIMGFLTDMFGMAIANGSLWLGLVIPDGPPLGATLIERTETIVLEFLMPFSFALVGLYTNVYVMADMGWTSLVPLLAMALTGYVAKIVGTLLTCLYFEMPFRDGLTLSLMVSLRGQVELLLFIHWLDKKLIQIPHFTLLVFTTIAITAVATPLINFLYDPSRPYMVNQRRTIQHHPPNTELRLVVCVYEQDTVAGLINLLEVSYPTLSSPFSVYALHLVDLMGRAVPVFLDYENEHDPAKYTHQDTILDALKLYQESRSTAEIKFHTFTTMAPMRSMYQDICELAMENKASIIILPFHNDCPGNVGGTEVIHNREVHSVNLEVLDHAPCSVGILVDKNKSFRNPFAGCSMRRPHSYSIHHYVILFLGGADAREALAFADRMAGNPEVTLTVIRFLSHYHEDDEMEKKLDDGVVTWFWVKNEGNTRVIYREVVVSNGAETVATVQTLNDDTYYDLWIVGRKQGINPVLLEGLENWSENHELGVIGDYIASSDFGGTASVLVVHQQILRDHGTTTTATSKKFVCTSVLSQF